MLIADGFIKNAMDSPQKTAIIQQGSRLTYKELYSRVLKLSQSLRKTYGLQPGEIAGILLPNCPQFLEIVLSCSLVGTKAAPINPKLSPREMGIILNWLKPRLIFGRSPAIENFKDCWVDIESGFYRQLLTNAHSKLVRPQEDSDFFLILTSGTSGQPKAVVRDQSSWAKSFVPVSEKLELKADDVMLIPGPLSYSASLMAALLTLHLGGTVHLLTSFNTAKVFTALEHATAAFMVPTMYRALLARGLKERLQNRQKHLILISAGEKLTPDAIQQLNCLPERIRLFEYYGAAELSFVSLLTPEDLQSKGSSVGRPFDEVTVSIRDKSGNTLPPYKVGKIWVRSPWLARGYHGSSKISCQNFQNGWATANDRGYLDADGYLYVLGRGDNYITSGGVKVYCSEIEIILQKHPLVKQAVVVGLPDRNRNQVAAAALEVTGNRQHIEKELRSYCLQSLSSYKRPRYYLFFSEFPRNAAGKIDREKILNICYKKFRP